MRFSKCFITLFFVLSNNKIPLFLKTQSAYAVGTTFTRAFDTRAARRSALTENRSRRLSSPLNRGSFPHAFSASSFYRPPSSGRFIITHGVHSLFRLVLLPGLLAPVTVRAAKLIKTRYYRRTTPWESPELQVPRMTKAQGRSESGPANRFLFPTKIRWEIDVRSVPSRFSANLSVSCRSLSEICVCHLSCHDFGLMCPYRKISFIYLKELDSRSDCLEKQKFTRRECSVETRSNLGQILRREVIPVNSEIKHRWTNLDSVNDRKLIFTQLLR